MKHVFTFFILISIPFINYSQNNTSNQKSKLFFEKAFNYYQAGDTVNSLIFCNKASSKDSLYTEPYILLSQIYYENKNLDKAIFYLKKAILISSEYSQLYFILAKYLMENKQYIEAEKYFKKYIDIDGIYKEQAEYLIKTSEFRDFSFKNPVAFVFQKLTDKINTSQSEYFPTISADNKTIVFTRLTGQKNHLQEDIFKYDANKNETEKFPANINTFNNEGAHSLSADGKILIFTRCIPGDGCDLFICAKDNAGKWSNPVKLPAPVNSEYWESQPSLSPNGRTLYFVSNRPNGYGKMDIWLSNFTEPNHWSNPVNLGDSINSSGNEMSPFIHFDNKTLYFSSDYIIGMGKFDIFKSTRINDSTWSKPQNLGFPINTQEDEYRLVVTPNGKTGYFSSERDTNFKQDIYSFQLQNSIKPQRTIYVSVNIYNNESKNILNADKISIINIKDNDTVYFSQNQSQFLICLPIDGEFAMNIIKKDFLFYSQNFSFEGINDTTDFFKIDVFLIPIVVSEKFLLKNIFFETDSYQINPKSFAELDKFVEFLKINPTLEIQINGHTDNIGSFDYNMKLSNNRALAVKNYIINKGIDEKRIKYAGFGFSVPIADNHNENGRKQNRRTEILILKK